MFKKSVCNLLILSSALASFAAATAKQIVSEAEKKSQVSESIKYVQNQLSSLSEGAEKRSTLAFLAALQEQSGNYKDAEKNYAAAAAIGSPDAPGMTKKSAEQLVLDAVRCALCLGDSDTADAYLNSAVRNSKNETILATVKLYEQWSVLCRASSVSQIEESLALLATYASLDSMKAVRPTILLTLWHVAGEEKWASELKKSCPKSIEAAIVKGEVQQLPTPFWFFVPRKGNTVPEVAAQSAAGGASISPASTSSGAASTTSSASTSSVSSSGRGGATTSSATTTSPNSSTSPATASEKPLKQQLGLFRDEANAKRLVEQVEKKGFKAYITTEKRASGTTYYLVVVDENKTGTMGNELRNAGFECYPLF